MLPPDDGDLCTLVSCDEVNDAVVIEAPASGTIYAAQRAFALLKPDGSVVTWGDPDDGGDSSSVAAELTGGVVRLFTNARAFAALKSDGSVVAWGDAFYVGDTSGGERPRGWRRRGVLERHGVRRAQGRRQPCRVGCRALRRQRLLGVQLLTSGVVEVFTNDGALAALKSDGSVVTWGSASSGGDSSAVASALSDSVVEIFSTPSARRAEVGWSVVTWGNGGYGGDSSAVASALSGGVVDVYSNGWAFAALKSDGSAVAWGNASNGGDASSVSSSLSGGVVDVLSTDRAFFARKSDSSVVPWGQIGNFATVAGDLTSGVEAVYASSYVINSEGFAALTSDGRVVTWGNTAAAATRRPSPPRSRAAFSPSPQAGSRSQR